MEAEYKRLLDLYKHHPEKYEAEKLQHMYPALDDPAFVQKIIAKKEFGRYISKLAKEDYTTISKAMCQQSDFRLSPNQNFVSNFLSPYTPYNGLLLFHGVGVGKTSSAISIAEKHYDVYKKRVLVILSGNIKDNFKKQIFDIHKYDMQTGKAYLSTGTKYPDMIFDKELMNKETLENKIARLIYERYQFIGYKQLSVMLKKIEDRVAKIERNESKREARYNEKIKELFSNRLIIIDEAHNLRMPSETGKKQISAALLSILQTVENTKLLLMTATPMFNDAKEIIWLLNLLLTNDKKPNLKLSSIFDKSGNLSATGKKKLEKIASNYISYMRGENPYSFPFRLFPSVNKDPAVIHTQHLELMGSIMSEYQRSRYDSIKVSLEDNTEDDDADPEALDNEEDEANNDMQNAVQVSNVAYPTYPGQKGFYECFERVDKKGFRYTAEHKHKQLFAYENLDTYAPKIKCILDRVIKSKGIVFIYSQYYYSGIYPLCIALEQIGFKKYNSAQGGIIEGAKVTNKFGTGSKAPSYIVLSRDRFLSPHNDAEIAMAKSLENKDGSIIKVVIVSRIGTEGIDFKNIREVHHLEPWYNLNRIEQIVGRAVRTCSHIALPKEDRNVTIYLHANQYDAKNTTESVDLRMYRISENKQLRIADVERTLKEASVDCPLNHDVLTMTKDKLNTRFDIQTSQGKTLKDYRIGDQDGSFLCGFGSCSLKCRVSPPPSNISTNASTFDLMFVSGEIDLYKRYIASLFRGPNLYYTFDEIYKLLSDEYHIIEKDILEYALEDLITHKHPIENGVLILRGANYILHKSTDIRASLKEREGVKYRPSKLDISVLNKHLEKEIPQDDKEVKEESDSDILDQVQSSVQELKSSLTLKISMKHIVDSVIDRLNEQDTLALITQVTKNPSASEMTQSLLSTGVFTPDLAYFYNRFTGTLFNTKKMAPVGPLEMSKIKPAHDAIMSKIKTVKELPPGIKGFIETRKGESKFKIKDNPDTLGYVCAQTSSLTLDDLKTRSGIKQDKDKNGKKYSKKSLCEVYELQLREQGAFARPWLLYPIKTKN